MRERAPHPERSGAPKGGDTHTPRRTAAEGREGEGGRGEGAGANTPDKRHGGVAERRPAEPAAARQTHGRPDPDALDGRRGRLKPLKDPADARFASEAGSTGGEASMAEPPAYPQCIPDSGLRSRRRAPTEGRGDNPQRNATQPISGAERERPTRGARQKPKERTKEPKAPKPTPKAKASRSMVAKRGWPPTGAARSEAEGGHGNQKERERSDTENATGGGGQPRHPSEAKKKRKKDALKAAAKPTETEPLGLRSPRREATERQAEGQAQRKPDNGAQERSDASQGRSGAEPAGIPSAGAMRRRAVFRPRQPFPSAVAMRRRAGCRPRQPFPKRRSYAEARRASRFCE